MKKWMKGLLIGTGATIWTLGILGLSCKFNRGSAQTAFAETSESASEISIPEDSLKITVALQNTYRAISSGVLPSVVEVHVTSTQKVKTYDPFKDFPFFFGRPDSNIPETKEYKQEGLGSGVIVRRNGNTVYVLTNNHVAGNADKISVKLNDSREFTCKIVGTDERMDIALLSFETEDKNISVAKLGDSDAIQQGDIVMALGSPLGYFASVTSGMVSAKGRSGDQIGSISDFIQTDAAINQGNSGGPLVNIYGEVIGINTWIASQSGGSVGLGFSIPINNIKTAIDQFVSNGKIAYGWLGVQLNEITEEYKKELGISEKQQGAFACQVFLGSPAMKGNLQAGDFIIRLNDTDIKDYSHLTREVGKIPAGTTVKFKVIRDGQKLELSVQIDERNNDAVHDNLKLWPGFIASPLTDDNRKQLGVEQGISGVVVTNMMEKTPAAALRLNNGDVITAVNGTKVTSIRDFYRVLNTNGKTEIWFDLYSGGHEITTGKYKIQK